MASAMLKKLAETAMADHEENAMESPKSPHKMPAPPKIFGDITDMKEKVRENLIKDQYDVTKLYKKEGLCQLLARHPIFENFTMTIILLNAIWIGIDADWNKAETLIEADAPFIVVENIFCAYFFLEWLVRFGAFRLKCDGLGDFWFVFDSILLSMMVFETWIFLIVLAVVKSEGNPGLGNASILRIARLLRLLRTARMARLMRALPELVVLIKGIAAAIRSVGITLCLLLAMIYVFGIAFKQLSEGTDAGEMFFSSVHHSMYTLLIDGALLDGIRPVLEEFQKAEGSQSVILSLLFWAFIILAAMTVMNMLLGVVCEVIGAVAAVEKEKTTVLFVKERMQEIMLQDGIDTDGNGQISKHEFKAIISNKSAMQTLEDVGVDPLALVELADTIFDEEDKELSFEDMMNIVLDLRGSNNATVKDIMNLRKYIGQKMRDSHNRLSSALSDRGVDGEMGPQKSKKSSRSVNEAFPGRRPSNGAAMATPKAFDDPASPSSNEMQAWLAWCEADLLARKTELKRFSQRMPQAATVDNAHLESNLPGSLGSPRCQSQAEVQQQIQRLEASMDQSLQALSLLQQQKTTDELH